MLLKIYFYQIQIKRIDVLCKAQITENINGNEKIIEKEITYQNLEDIGLIILLQNDDEYCSIQIPCIFIEIFAKRCKNSFKSILNFTNVEYWQEWEKFNNKYMSFRETLVYSYLDSNECKLNDLFKGALFTNNTGEITLFLENKVETCELSHQFPTHIRLDEKIETHSHGNISWKDTKYCSLNAPGAPAGDIIKPCLASIKNESKNIFFNLQTKLESKGDITWERIKKEHAKNIDAFNKLNNDKIKVITVIIASVDIETETDLIDDVVIISKNQFRAYFGEYFEQLAFFASISCLNVNIMTYEELMKFNRIGEVTAQKIISERKISYLKDFDDLKSRVSISFPKNLNIKF